MALFFFFVPAILPLVCRVCCSARLSPFGSVQSILWGDVGVPHIVLQTVKPSLLGTSVWSLAMQDQSECCPSHRSYVTSYKSSFPHLLHDWADAHPLSDVFVCHVVPSGQTKTPSQHSQFHCVKGLLMLGCCRPTFRSIEGYRMYYSLVNLGFHSNGHSLIARNTGDLAPFHPGGVNSGSEVNSGSIC